MENGKTVGYYENLALRVARFGNLKIWFIDDSKMGMVTAIFSDKGPSPGSRSSGVKWRTREELDDTMDIENLHRDLLCRFFTGIHSYIRLGWFHDERMFELVSESTDELDLKLTLHGV